jgi:uncharacterized protein YxjI
MRCIMRQKLLSFGDEFHWMDTDGVDVNDGGDRVLVLASAVVVDQACPPGDARRH